MRREPREKKHRLAPECYRGEVTVLITGCTRGRRPGLLDPELHGAFARLLAESVAAFECDIPIYGLMPDHLHLLIRGRTADSDAYSATLKFKLRFGIWLDSHRHGLRLQKGFNDHILRLDEGRHDQMIYIAGNPVRAGFVKNPLDWPYTGSIGYDLRDLLR